MSKTLTLKSIRDNKSFRISKFRKTVWTVIGKSKGVATIESQGGSTRFYPLTKKVYPV